MIKLKVDRDELLKRLNGYPIGCKDIFYNDLHVGDRIKIFYNIFDRYHLIRDFAKGYITYDINKKIHYIKLLKPLPENFVLNIDDIIIFENDLVEIPDYIKDETNVINSQKYVKLADEVKVPNHYEKLSNLLKNGNIEKFDKEIIKLNLDKKIELLESEMTKKIIDFNDDNLQIICKFDSAKMLLKLINFDCLIEEINKAILSSFRIDCCGKIYLGNVICKKDKTSMASIGNIIIFWDYEVIDDEKAKLIISDEDI